MKLATFVNPYTGEERMGILLADGEDPLILDANAFFAKVLEEEGEEDPQVLADALLPPTVLGYLRRGRRAEESARTVLEEARRRLRNGEQITGISGARVTFRQSEVRLKAPIPRPPKIIHTAGNFREHAEEAEKAGWPFPIPQWISFLKSPSAVIGPFDPIVYPKFVKELDYELEVAIVIGRRGKYISEARAFDHVAGFMVFNDVTARDIQREEMKNGLLNFGKNLDTFAPMGPYLVTKDEIPDPHNLRMELRVNGEVRQSGSTSRLSVRMEQIISRYSWVTLEPGDIITTGTISGVAAFRENPHLYYLKPGDVVESFVERIGTMRNPVVKEEG